MRVDIFCGILAVACAVFMILLLVVQHREDVLAAEDEEDFSREALLCSEWTLERAQARNNMACN